MISGGRSPTNWTGWGLVRAFNTQPALVLRFEATDQNRLEEIRRIFMDQVEKQLALLTVLQDVWRCGLN